MSAPAEAERGCRRLPRLHAVTDDTLLRREGWEEVAARVVDAGGPEIALHLRGKSLPSRTLLALATSLNERARSAGASVFLNDRVDVALVVDAAGVHLGGASLAPDVARGLVGPDKWIGVSKHDAESVARASGEGADYAFLGTIFRTTSHPGVEGLGLAELEKAVRRSSPVPVIGIGGIGPQDAAAVGKRGAYGVAAIRGIWDAPDPEAAVKLYLQGLGT